MKIFRRIFTHNWFTIIYFNFKLLPFRQAMRFPIYFYHKVRFYNLSGKIFIKGKIKPAMIKIGGHGSDMFAPTATILYIKGTIIFNGPCIIGVNSYIRTEKDAILGIGNNAIIGAHNILFCTNEISLGDDFLSSWKCQYMDSDTHSIIDKDTLRKSIMQKPIRIGKHVWLGNHVLINKGTIIPDDCIVASSSLCNKDYNFLGSSNILAGIPALKIAENKTWSL